MAENIIVIGGGGHAKVLISMIKKIKDFNLVGYTDVKDNGSLLGVKYLGCDSMLEEIREKLKVNLAAIGVGMININLERENIFKSLKAFGFKLPVIISPSSIVNECVIIDEGSVVFDGVVINSGSKIGKGCIINTNCTIEHDCNINSFSQVCPGAVLSGGVEVGKHCLIGSGVSVKQYLRITDYCVIGVGAAIIKDCNEPGIYAGVPARRRT